MAAFVIATLCPLPLLALAALVGGPWGWIALIWLTGLTALLDALLPKNWQNAPTDRTFDAGVGLSLTLGLAHLWLVLIALRVLGDPAGPRAGPKWAPPRWPSPSISARSATPMRMS